MTLTALAKLAHVSLSTASKAFMMRDDVNEETREMIFNIAKENGCFRTFFKAKYPKLMVGIVCYEVRSKYYSSTVEAIKKELEKANCEVCLFITDFDEKQNSDAVSYFEEYTTVDAIIFIGSLPNANAKHEIPIACFSNKPIENANLSINVVFDNAIKRILETAKRQGINEIGFIGENLTLGKMSNVESCYKQVFNNSDGLHIVTVKERFEPGGYNGMKKMFAEYKPKLVICAYDNMAFGAMRYAHEIGLSIPKDIQIIGMDNIEETKYSVPSLSTIGFDRNNLSKSVVSSFIDIIMEKKEKDFLTFEAEFIENESSKLN